MSTIQVQPGIMAGGRGTRLWPLSRAQYPKQFLVLQGTQSLLQATRTAAAVFTVLIGALLFGYFLTITQVPQKVTEFLTGLGIGPYGVLALIMVMYLVLGCLMDAMAMIILTVPIIFPVIMHLGFDPIWFGVIIVMTVELGLIHPPVGMNVFVIKSVIKDVDMSTIFLGVLPFVVTDLLRAMASRCLESGLSQQGDGAFQRGLIGSGRDQGFMSGRGIGLLMGRQQQPGMGAQLALRKVLGGIAHLFDDQGAGQLAGQGVQGVGTLGGLLRFLSPQAQADGEVADDERHDQHHGKGQQVLHIADGKRHARRHKKVVKRTDVQKRGQHCGAGHGALLDHHHFHTRPLHQHLRKRLVQNGPHQLG